MQNTSDRVLFYIPSSLKSFQVLLDTEEIYLEREYYCSNEEADFMLCSYVESVFERSFDKRKDTSVFIIGKIFDVNKWMIYFI